MTEPQLLLTQLCTNTLPALSTVSGRIWTWTALQSRHLCPRLHPAAMGPPMQVTAWRQQEQRQWRLAARACLLPCPTRPRSGSLCGSVR